MTEYSTMYEYVAETVKRFINDQEEVYKLNQAALFGDGAWLFAFFTINPQRLALPEVMQSIDTLCASGASTEPTEQTPYNTALARVYGLYTTLYASSGVKFMEQVQKNAIEGLVKLNTTPGVKERVVRRSLTNLFDRHPELIISVIGNSYYAKRCVAARHQMRLVKKST